MMPAGGCSFGLFPRNHWLKRFRSDTAYPRVLPGRNSCRSATTIRSVFSNTRRVVSSGNTELTVAPATCSLFPRALKNTRCTESTEFCSSDSPRPSTGDPLFTEACDSQSEQGKLSRAGTGDGLLANAAISYCWRWSHGMEKKSAPCSGQARDFAYRRGQTSGTRGTGAGHPPVALRAMASRVSFSGARLPHARYGESVSGTPGIPPRRSA
jgi:hypothetical protein